MMCVMYINKVEKSVIDNYSISLQGLCTMIRAKLHYDSFSMQKLSHTSIHS